MSFFLWAYLIVIGIAAALLWLCRKDDTDE